jgi:hypothetical protein
MVRGGEGDGLRHGGRARTSGRNREARELRGMQPKVQPIAAIAAQFGQFSGR